MAAGRCAGCGRIDSVRKVSQHIVDCADYLVLYQADPGRCLTPAGEYERYRREETSAVARAEQRGTRLAARFREINRHQAVSTARWQRPPDILE
jgi:hypothetical protein